MTPPETKNAVRTEAAGQIREPDDLVTAIDRERGRGEPAERPEIVREPVPPEHRVREAAPNIRLAGDVARAIHREPGAREPDALIEDAQVPDRIPRSEGGRRGRADRRSRRHDRQYPNPCSHVRLLLDRPIGRTGTRYAREAARSRGRWVVGTSARIFGEAGLRPRSRLA